MQHHGQRRYFLLYAFSPIEKQKTKGVILCCKTLDFQGKQDSNGSNKNYEFGPLLYGSHATRQYLYGTGSWQLSFYYGDLQLLPEVDHLPQLEVPYPLTNGGQQFRRASGSCSVPFCYIYPIINLTAYNAWIPQGVLKKVTICFPLMSGTRKVTVLLSGASESFFLLMHLKMLAWKIEWTKSGHNPRECRKKIISTRNINEVRNGTNLIQVL